MARGFKATVFDAWARVTHPWFRIEAEWSMILATVDQPSLIPGVLFHDPVTSKQHGGALESEVGSEDSIFGVGRRRRIRERRRSAGIRRVSESRRPRTEAR